MLISSSPMFTSLFTPTTIIFKFPSTSSNCRTFREVVYKVLDSQVTWEWSLPSTPFGRTEHKPYTLFFYSTSTLFLLTPSRVQLTHSFSDSFRVVRRDIKDQNWCPSLQWRFSGVVWTSRRDPGSQKDGRTLPDSVSGNPFTSHLFTIEFKGRHQRIDDWVE